MAILTVTKENFEQEIEKSEKAVLLDFWANWCVPCRMAAPIIEQIAEENPQILVGKVNVDEEPELAFAFHVASIPMFVAMKNGQAVGKTVGVSSKEELLALFE